MTTTKFDPWPLTVQPALLEIEDFFSPFSSSEKKDHRVVYINLRKSMPEGLKEK